jgi:hypothetical protein
MKLQNKFIAIYIHSYKNSSVLNTCNAYCITNIFPMRARKTTKSQYNVNLNLYLHFISIEITTRSFFPKLPGIEQKIFFFLITTLTQNRSQIIIIIFNLISMIQI